MPRTTTGGSVGQSNTLLGLGQNEHLLHTVSISTLDPQSLAGDPLAGIEAKGSTPVFAGITNSSSSSFLDVNQSDPYLDGQMVPIGVFRHFFICHHHLDGLCDQFFDNREALEDHFESAHFAITRMKPAERYTCSACWSINDFNTGRCQTCGADGCIEIWIYGNIIGTSSYQRHPDGQDPFRMDMSSLAPLFKPYNSLNTDSQFGHRADNVDGFNDSVHGGRYNYEENNTSQNERLLSAFSMENKDTNSSQESALKGVPRTDLPIAYSNEGVIAPKTEPNFVTSEELPQDRYIPLAYYVFSHLLGML
jgi:hypothetical protein